MGFIINGKRIENAVFEDEFESIKEHYQNLGEVVCCDRDEEFRTYARDNVINRHLLEQESIQRFGPVDDATVEARFEALQSEHGGEREFYENSGFNPGDRKMILEKIRSSLLVDRVLETEIKVASPDEKDLEAYYQQNIDRYMSQEEVRVSQIFIEPASHEAAREAYIALRALRKELLAGKDFDQAAREHGSDGDRDIDLGFMKQGETMPEVEAITFSLEPGEISPIVATHYGFHIFKLTERKQPSPIPLEEIKGLKEQYLAEKRTGEIESLIEKLKKEGKIEEFSEAE